jgi:hypothetical protein
VTATNYPAWAPGMDITGQRLRDTEGYYIYKTADAPARTGTTPAADPDLTFAMDANAVYHVKTYLRYTALNTDDFRTDWSVPSGAAGNRSCLGPGSTVTTSATPAEANLMHTGVHGFGTDVDYGGLRNSTSNQTQAWEEGFVTTSSAGTFSQNWSSAAGGSGAILCAGSYAWYRRVA